MKVKQVMEKPVFIPQNAAKKEILRIVKKNKKTKIFIVADKNRRFLGDIHEDDLFYMMIPNEHHEAIGTELGFDLEKKFFAKSAKEIMRKHDVYCNENEEVISVALKLADAEVNEMPVLNKNGQVIGVVTQGILLRHMVQND